MSKIRKFDHLDRRQPTEVEVNSPAEVDTLARRGLSCEEQTMTTRTKSQLEMAKSQLEMAAMTIVLESSNKITKSSAYTAYVRQKLIGDLEQALRDAGWNMDDAIKRVLESKKRERKAARERRDTLNAERRAKYRDLVCDDCWDRYGTPSNLKPREGGRCNSCGAPLAEAVTS